MTELKKISELYIDQIYRLTLATDDDKYNGLYVYRGVCELKITHPSNRRYLYMVFEHQNGCQLHVMDLLFREMVAGKYYWFSTEIQDNGPLLFDFDSNSEWFENREHFGKEVFVSIELV
jgi:hypothetical protein